MNTEGALLPEAWEEELSPDDPDRDFIIAGVRDGFHIVDRPLQANAVETNNYKSATCTDYRELVEAQIKEEIVNGRYRITDKKPTIVSALGAIPKHGTGYGVPPKVRLIHDASRPAGNAINDYAEKTPFQYQSLQEATDMLQTGFYMCKVDLASAYRSVKIHPSNYTTTGLKWSFGSDASPPVYMYDTRLPFGARRAPYIFHTLGQSVRRMMLRKGYDLITVMLDDFFIASSTREGCLQAMLTLIQLLRKLGFAINYDKVTWPSQRLVFLGITLDTTSMTVELPENKLSELSQLLTQTLVKKKISKKELQSLAGKLNYATQCIYGGRFFLRRIFDAIARL